MKKSALLAVVLAVTCACNTTKYVQVPDIRTDTLLVTSLARDSIYVHDSTYIRESADTVRIERWRTRYIERTVHDTVRSVRVDSVAVPYPVEVEVPAKISRWQRWKMNMGVAFMAVLAAILLWELLVIKRKL